MPNDTVLDWQDLTSRITEKDVLQEISQVFLSDSQDRITQLQRAIGENDAGAIASLAHALRGAAGALSCPLLVAACKNLENAANQDQSDDFAMLLEDLQHEFSRVRDIMSHPNWVVLAESRYTEMKHVSCNQT